MTVEIKAKNWDGSDLKGEWEVSHKIDGVQAICKDGEWMSRAGKPLYNLPDDCVDGIYEVYYGTWEDSVSACRTHDGEAISDVHIYILRPWLDSRLEAGTMIDPDAETIRFRMERAMREGYEGLMLRQGDKLLKVKPKETHDVPITGIQPGTGKHEGRMGALLTPMGKVGTGFTDEMRENFNDQRWIGIIIEVECMGLTPGGKFRHPRFVRVREDKC